MTTDQKVDLMMWLFLWGPLLAVAVLLPMVPLIAVLLRIWSDVRERMRQRALRKYERMERDL